MKIYTDESRREFLRKLITSTSMLGLAPLAGTINSCTDSVSKSLIPQRAFGKTGHMVGIYSLGAQATCEQLNRREDAMAIINRSIDLGINYIDTSAAYGRDGDIGGKDLQGTSERHLGEVMKTRRNEVFLATKTHDRSYDGAMRHLESSLENLKTDVIDLWQIHNVKTFEKDNIEKIFADDGCLKALQKARDEGTVRFLGITGHEDPESMKEVLSRFQFDTCLMALNAADKHYNSFIEKLLPMCVDSEMGIIGMKIPARDRIFDHGGILSMKEAMSYTMSLPVSTIIIGIDNLSELEENIQITREFVSLSENEMLAIEDKVKPHKDHLLFFKELSSWPKGWSGNDV